jgi:predicted N-acetyltransferase YhbS
MSPDVAIRPVSPEDLPQILDLHARVFGPGRFARTAYRLREGTAAISAYCLLARRGGVLIAAIRFTPITIGGERGALLLGPLAVEPDYAGQGYGKRLVATGIDNARNKGVPLVVLVGDEPYYGRFGFRPVAPGHIVLPGPVDPRRLLAAELAPGALSRFRGLAAPDCRTANVSP